MLNFHLLECTLKGYDYISDLLLAKYWVITGCECDGCSKLLEVYCYAEKVPTASSYPYPHYIFAYAFGTSFIKNSILRVPAASIDSYKASEPWKHFGQIVALTEW